jgi:ABC-type transport system involved in multi-copper enzyme maturation permease subunit
MRAPAAYRSSLAGHVYGSVVLALISLRRSVRSRQNAVCGLLLVAAGLAATAWSLRHGPDSQEFVSEVVLPVYVSFLLPMFCLCCATPSIAADREEQTLVYLLATPLPRPMICTAKYAASLGLALAWSVGTWAVLTQCAGPVGRRLFAPFCPAVLWSTVAYVGLFHLFSVVLRRATVVALVYALFLETLLGNMPGVAKRVAVSFYTECMILDAGAKLGLPPTVGREPELLLPVSGDVAWTVLCVLGLIFFAAGVWRFSRAEYA